MSARAFATALAVLVAAYPASYVVVRATHRLVRYERSGCIARPDLPWVYRALSRSEFRAIEEQSTPSPWQVAYAPLVAVEETLRPGTH